MATVGWQRGAALLLLACVAAARGAAVRQADGPAWTLDQGLATMEAHIDDRDDPLDLADPHADEDVLGPSGRPVVEELRGLPVNKDGAALRFQSKPNVVATAQSSGKGGTAGRIHIINNINHDMSTPAERALRREIAAKRHAAKERKRKARARRHAKHAKKKAPKKPEPDHNKPTAAELEAERLFKKDLKLAIPALPYPIYPAVKQPAKTISAKEAEKIVVHVAKRAVQAKKNPPTADKKFAILGPEGKKLREKEREKRHKEEAEKRRARHRHRHEKREKREKRRRELHKLRKPPRRRRKKAPKKPLPPPGWTKQQWHDAKPISTAELRRIIPGLDFLSPSEVQDMLALHALNKRQGFVMEKDDVDDGVVAMPAPGGGAGVQLVVPGIDGAPKTVYNYMPSTEPGHEKDISVQVDSELSVPQTPEAAAELKKAELARHIAAVQAKLEAKMRNPASEFGGLALAAQ